MTLVVIAVFSLYFIRCFGSSNEGRPDVPVQHANGVHSPASVTRSGDDRRPRSNNGGLLHPEYDNLPLLPLNQCSTDRCPVMSGQFMVDEVVYVLREQEPLMRLNQQVDCISNTGIEYLMSHTESTWKHPFD